MKEREKFPFGKREMGRGYNGRNLKSGPYNEYVHKAPRGSKCGTWTDYGPCDNKADYEYEGMVFCDQCFYDADYL